MFSNSFEMTIHVGHKSIEEFYHEGSSFVEGRKGSEYSIRLKNLSDSRACFVLSVDGLSVIDGQEAGAKSPGYVVEARGTLDVSCYKVDDSTGAKFVFGSKDKSYSAEVGMGTANTGVIAAMVFKEKPQPLFYTCSSPSIGTSIQSKSFGGLRGGGFQTGSWSSNSSGEMSNSSGSMSASVRPTQSVAPPPPTRGIAPSDDDFDHAGLGTSFGGAMDWRTHTVTFERESDYPNANLVLYYDSKKNLERRGIEFKKKVPPLPNPFPGNGCPVPSGWRK